jgi:prevent-host-death family protein
MSPELYAIWVWISPFPGASLEARGGGSYEEKPDSRHDSGYAYGQITKWGTAMRFASVAEVKNQLSRYLAVSRRKREAIVVTHHGKPYALIQPLSEQDLEELE